MIGQAGPGTGICVFTLRRCRWCRLRLDACDVGVEVLQAELELVVIEALGTASEPAALQRPDDLPEPIDLGARVRPLALEGSRQFADHPMQRADVVRQSSEVYVHEAILDRLPAPDAALLHR
jgi:hypothetical protein